MWSNGAYSSWNSYYQLKVLALLKLFWILLYSSFIKQGTSQTFLDPGPAYLLITTNWKVLGSGQNNHTYFSGQNNKMVYGALNVQTVTCIWQSPASLQCGHWSLSPPTCLVHPAGRTAGNMMVSHSEAAGARLRAQHRFLKVNWLITWTLGREFLNLVKWNVHSSYEGDSIMFAC